jgi:hypothetical protein
MKWIKKFEAYEDPIFLAHVKKPVEVRINIDTSIYYKQLDPIWNECFENDTISTRQNFLTTMFKVLERDRKLKELLG